MATVGSTTTTDRFATKRIGASVWILRPRGVLERDALGDLRRAFRDALDQGARDIVIDLSLASAVSADVATALSAAADAMIARDGVLWISVPWPEGDGFTLRPIRTGGVEGLLDVGALLERASVLRSEGPARARDATGRAHHRDGGPHA